MLKLVHLSDFHFSAFPRWADSIQLIISIRNKRLALTPLVPFKPLERFTHACHDEDLAEIAASFVYDEFSDHDAIIISGDLATRGFKSDLSLVKRFIFSPSIDTTTIYTSSDDVSLNTNGRPIIILPGNHDRYDDVLGRCAGKEFDKVFEDEWPSGLRGVQGATIRNSNGDGLSIISADFTLASWWNARPRHLWTRFGQGRSTQKVVDQLVRKSEDVILEEPDAPLIWMCHFPPTDDPLKVSKSLRLVDCRRLIEAAKDFGVSYIICGHTHQPNIFAESGINIIVAGSMCVPDVLKGCWMHSLWFDTKKRRATLINQEDFAFDFSRSSFVKK